MGRVTEGTCKTPEDQLLLRFAWNVEKPLGYKHKSSHAAYMRVWRKDHPISAEERFKMNCRSYTHQLIKYGTLIPEPCIDCGTLEKLEGHHPDYSNPRLVWWFCRPHHLAYHKRLRQLDEAA